MPKHEATFEIDTKTDAHAVRLLMERTYNIFREELKETGERRDDRSETLEELAAIREAARRTTPGTLRIVFEQRDESFDE